MTAHDSIAAYVNIIALSQSHVHGPSTKLLPTRMCWRKE